MSTASPDNFCYRQLMSRKGIPNSKEANKHLYICDGYSRNLNSSYPCLDFVSITEIKRGICAYELRARNGQGESPVRTIGHSCNGCNSNHDSGKDINDHTACTAYTPMIKVILGSCAWHIRSQRLLNLYDGDKAKLKSEEKHCLEECDASRSSSCPGYINIKHVVEQTCQHKVNLDNKLRMGGKIIGLEELCADCTGQCKSKRCESSFISVTEKHHFEVWNEVHPLAPRTASNEAVSA